MDADIFIANVDAIRDRVADYVKMMSEGEAETDEGVEEGIFSKKGEEKIKVSNDMKIGKALSDLESALFELNFLGVISDNDYMNFWMDKYGELYMDTMSQLDPSVQKKYEYEGLDDEGLDEGLGDQIGAAFQGIGKGVSSVLSVLIGAVVAIGVLIVAGAGAALSGVVTLLGFAGAGIIRAVEKLIVVPSINSALKRLSEDEEVMAIAMKPSASGLRKIADEKLTTSERMVVGNWIKKNVTREMLGVNRRWRGGKYVATKSKKGPGLKDGDYTPLI